MAESFDLDSILEQTLKEFEEDDFKTSTSTTLNDSTALGASDPTNRTMPQPPSAMSPDRESYEAQCATASSESEVDQMAGLFNQLTQHFVDSIKKPIEHDDDDNDIDEEGGDKYDEVGPFYEYLYRYGQVSKL
jgi:hypothetical protein